MTVVYRTRSTCFVPRTPSSRKSSWCGGENATIFSSGFREVDSWASGLVGSLDVVTDPPGTDTMLQPNRSIFLCPAKKPLDDGESDA